MIKLVVSDVDGTLLKKGEERLSEAALQVVRRLSERGVLFAAASGRSYSELRRLFGAAGDQMAFICSDGALTIYRGKVLEELPMDGEKARRLYVAAMKHSAYSVLVLLSVKRMSAVRGAFIQVCSMHIRRVPTGFGAWMMMCFRVPIV